MNTKDAASRICDMVFEDAMLSTAAHRAACDRIDRPHTWMPTEERENTPDYDMYWAASCQWWMKTLALASSQMVHFASDTKIAPL